ncbi:hypothetical protein MTO96_024816 [Rhipicephalus appendiculatus]
MLWRHLPACLRKPHAPEDRRPRNVMAGGAIHARTRRPAYPSFGGTARRARSSAAPEAGSSAASTAEQGCVRFLGRLRGRSPPF